MAIRLIDQYPNRAGVPNADYPHGVPRNKSTPTSTDGTPFEQAWFRDQEGFFQGLLETAGITPSGSPDTVEQSDYFDSLVSAMHGVTEVDVGGVGDVTLGIYPSRVAALRLTGTLGDDVDLIVPDTERLYTIIDETTGGFSVNVRTNAGLGVEIDGGTTVVRSDGVNVLNVSLLAKNTAYDNTTSGLTAETAQAAIDELFEKGIDIFSQQTLGSTGYQTLTGGLILQWGTYTSSTAGKITGNFSVTFPNVHFGSVGSFFGPFTAATGASLKVEKNNTSSFRFAIVDESGAFSSSPAFILHIGY